MASGNLATPAFGIAFKLYDASDANPTTIASLKDLNTTLAAQIEDTTAHDSGAPWRQRTPTLLSMGPIEAQLNWIPAGATHGNTTGLLAVWAARASRKYATVFPNSGPTWTGFAVIGNIKLTHPTAGIQGASVTFEGDGVWTLA